MKIDINNLAAVSGVSLERIALELFPDNKRPHNALRLVRSGEQELKESQIVKLAAILNCSVSELFTDKWKLKNDKDLICVMTRDNFTARLDVKTGVLRVTKDGDLVSEIYFVSPALSVSELLETINTLTK